MPPLDPANLDGVGRLLGGGLIRLGTKYAGHTLQTFSKSTTAPLASCIRRWCLLDGWWIMSQDAIWVPLSVDWFRSDMFDDATDGHRLAWVILLCYIKSTGRAGKAQVRVKRFATDHHLSLRSVEEMVKSAQESRAIIVDGDTITLCNWRLYNDRKRFGKRGNCAESYETSEKSLPSPSPSPSKEEKNKSACITISQVEEIYQAYPIKAGKRQALPAIKSAIKEIQDRGESDPVGWLIQRVEAYAKSPKGRSKQFAGYPQGWFNQGHYDDDAMAWENGDSSTPKDNAASNSPPRNIVRASDLDPVREELAREEAVDVELLAGVSDDEFAACLSEAIGGDRRLAHLQGANRTNRMARAEVCRHLSNTRTTRKRGG